MAQDIILHTSTCLIWTALRILPSGYLGAAPLQVDCVEARNKEKSAGYNEMALSILEVISAVGGGGCFSAQHHTASLIRLVKALSQLLSQRHPGAEAPLKLRAAAADALGKMAAARQLAPIMLPCIGGRACTCCCLLSTSSAGEFRARGMCVLTCVSPANCC